MSKADAASGTSHMMTSLMVAAWYSCNIAMILMNKFMLTSAGFHHPVFLTLCHMSTCAALGGLLSLAKITTLAPIKTSGQMWKVFLLSCIFCTTVVLGNASLRFITVSFGQAIGAATVLFTAILSFIFQGARESHLTYAALIPIVAGVVITSGGEPEFHLLGFLLCLASTAGSAAKSVVQSIVMTDPSEKLDPLSLLLYMSSICVLLLIPATLLLEPNAALQAHTYITNHPRFGYWLLANSLLAYGVNLTNFLVTKYTSALTLQVLGNAKGVVAAMVSVFVFANRVTVQGIVGYSITILGVFWYSESKRRSLLGDKGSPVKAADVELQEESFSDVLDKLLPDPSVQTEVSAPKESRYEKAKGVIKAVQVEHA
ncbi:MAG: hypothetical protein WDW38_000095 [Sanguina aurantia]